VALAFGLRKPQPPSAARHEIPALVGDDQEWRWPFWWCTVTGAGFVGRPAALSGMSFILALNGMDNDDDILDCDAFAGVEIHSTRALASSWKH